MFIRKAVTTLALTLACAVVLAPAPALAGHEGKTRVVLGKAWGTVTVDVRTLEIGGQVTAVMTHIGKVDSTAVPTDRAVIDGVTRVRGTFVWTHANGDTIVGTYTAQGAPPTTEVHTADWVFTITGGTGRFAGATGRVWAHLELTPFQGPPIIAERLEAVTWGYIRY
jgi:hypothetical protein